MSVDPQADLPTLRGDGRPQTEEAGEPLTRGDVVGRYVVVDRVGAGGMGVVYGAFDPELDRKVAIKLLAARGDRDASSQTERARLLAEARAMAKVDHPNVVAVHDVGEHDGRVFLAMDLVRGVTLGEWLTRDKRPWREIVAAFVEAGEGLAAAHQEGLVHRDFKPDNVMVSEDRVRVMDFGLARPFFTEDGDRRPITGESDVVTPPSQMSGTPRYMAPEQWSGTKIDERTDQFSFCVALYEALFGAPPFEGRDLPGLAINVTSGDLPRPPAGVVPGRVSRAVLRGLSLQPEKRFTRMEFLLEELRVPRRSRRWLAGALVSAAIGLGAGVVLARSDDVDKCAEGDVSLAEVWANARRQQARASFARTGVAEAEETWRRIDGELASYVEAWESVHATSCESADSAAPLRMHCLELRLIELDARLALFASADESVVRRAPSIVSAATPVQRCRDEARLRLSPPPPTDPGVAAAVRAERAKVAEAHVLNDAGRHSQALEVAEAAVAAALELGYEPLLAEAYYERGWAAESEGDYASARQSFEAAAFTGRASLSDEVARDAATRLVSLVGLHEGKFEEALQWAEHARSELARHPGWEDSRANASLLRQVGSVYLVNGSFDLARENLRRALEIATARSGGTPNIQVAHLYDALGVATLQQGELETSRGYFERALEMREKIYGGNHPKVAQTLGNYGNLLDAVDEDERAEEMQRRALAIRESTYGADHPETAKALDSLAQLAAQRGDISTAKSQYERAIAIKSRAMGPEHPSVGLNVFNLGHLLLGAGEREAAAQQFERALQIFLKAHGEDHQRVKMARKALADARD